MERHLDYLHLLVIDHSPGPGGWCSCTPLCTAKTNGNMGNVLYFFCYTKKFFSFQNNPKSLDLSYKTDLDLWDCLRRVKHLYPIAKFHRTD